MKRQIYWVTLCVVLITVLEAKAQQKKDLLTGAWVLNYNASVNAMSSLKKNFYDTLKNESKQRASSFYSNRELVFDGVGGFKMILPNGMIREGSYTFSSPTLTLIDGGNSQEIIYTVKKINRNQLVLRLEGQNADKAILKELHFKGIKK